MMSSYDAAIAQYEINEDKNKAVDGAHNHIDSQLEELTELKVSYLKGSKKLKKQMP
jgi:hypothetical protein